MGYLEALEGGDGRTAFRVAEKKYKLYKEISASKRHHKNRQRDKQPLAVDLSSVVDLREMTKDLQNGHHQKTSAVRVLRGFDWPVIITDAHPGFYFIPSALSPEEQVRLIQASLRTYPEPPNRTNHDVLHGPISDLWERAQRGDLLPAPRRATSSAAAASSTSPSTAPADVASSSSAADVASSISAVEVASFRRGMSADSTLENVEARRSSGARQDVEEDEAEDLGSECRESSGDSRGTEGALAGNVSPVEGGSVRMVEARAVLRKLRWATLGLQYDWSKRDYNPSLPYRPIPADLAELSARLAVPALCDSGRVFQAEAAIVNFYGPGDMLSGHLDDVEADVGKPIVSISLGCKAVFLLGGRTRDEEPMAMFLRSGDVVLMAGPTRHCYHGVPRIFTDEEHSDLPPFLREGLATSEFSSFAKYMATSRININVREVRLS